MAYQVNESTFTETAQSAGLMRRYIEQCIIGQGAAAPIVGTIAGTQPPCTTEISILGRTSAGIYTCSMSSVYYARAYAAGDIDDTAGTGMYMTVGNWANLGCLGTPTGLTTFTLRSYNAGGTPTDIPLGVSAFLSLAMKKEFSGAVA
jgi:hypothetical protein